MAKDSNEGLKQLGQPELAGFLDSYVKKLKENLEPTMVILFGSRAKGNYLRESDVDVVVVAEKFKDVDFFERIRYLIDLWDAPYVLEPFGYAPEEFERMFNSHNLTALDAIDQGLELTGSPEFVKYKKRLEELKLKGHLSRDEKGWWKLPP